MLACARADSAQCFGMAAQAPVVDSPLPPLIRRKPAEPERRELARKLYYQGVPREEMAKQCNVSPYTIDSWRVRDQWQGNRRAGTPEKPLQAVQTTTLTIAQPQHDQPLRAKAYAKAEKLLESVHDKLPKDPRGMKDVATGFSSIVSAIQAIEGWSDLVHAHLSIHTLAKPVDEIVVSPVSQSTTVETQLHTKEVITAQSQVTVDQGHPTPEPPLLTGE